MEKTTASSDDRLQDSPLFINAVRYFQKLQELQLVLLDRYKREPTSSVPAADPFNLSDVTARIWANIFRDPQHFWESQTRLYAQAMTLWQQTPENRNIDQKTEAYQKYFKNAFWDNSFLFKTVKETYLMTALWLLNTIEEETLGLNKADKERTTFFLRQYIEAMNPRNFPLTNPEVIEETLNTHGENLIKGLDNLIHDIEKGRKFPAVSMTDETAFRIGGNIAATKGAVVFENDYMEMIQYEPTTETVFKTPLLIVPPWINKYYILDLKPENSFIGWLVDQGHRVFVISWVNPDKRFSDKGFKDYMDHALLKALDVVNAICETKQANVIGYCIGGTLLAMTLAYLEANQIPSPVSSATFMTTLLDFEQAGDLKVFIDEEQLQTLDKIMEEQGVLDGETMKMTFSMLRAGDLIWSFVVNNYLLGRDPVPFDLLYWNNDATNLPAAIHHDYLSSMYLNNRLAKGDYALNGTRLDLGRIETPSYFLSAQEDHIAPWKATYDGARLFGGATVFTLAGSGHVAGVVNPPHKNKYGYRTAEKIIKNADSWLKSSTPHNGSWWPHWQEWIKKQNKNETIPPSRALGNKIFQKKRAAPGKNVLRKS